MFFIWPLYYIFVLICFCEMKGLWVTLFPLGWLYFYSGFQFLGRLYAGMLLHYSRKKTFPSWWKFLFWNTCEIVIISGALEYIVKSKSPVLNSLFQAPNLMVKAAERALTNLWNPLERVDFRISSHGWEEGRPVKEVTQHWHCCPILHLSLPQPQARNMGRACLVSGILKFHEHYLGDNTMENAGDFQAGSSANLPTATSSALEQHIASVREALGVESYYSRQVVHRPQTQSPEFFGFVFVLVNIRFEIFWNSHFCA